MAPEAELWSALRRAARRRPTPFYATDMDALDAACAAVTDAFPDPWLRQYSVKADDTPAVIAASQRSSYNGRPRPRHVIPPGRSLP